MVVLVYKRYNNNYLIHSCIAQGLHLDHAVHYWLICRRHFCFARRGKDTHYPRVYYIVLRVKILHWCHQSSPLSRYSVAMSDQRHQRFFKARLSLVRGLWLRTWYVVIPLLWQSAEEPSQKSFSLSRHASHRAPVLFDITRASSSIQKTT